MIVSILVLEETFGVKSFSDDKSHEFIFKTLNKIVIILSWISLTVEGDSSGIIKDYINWFFETFLSENFVNAITELSP